MRCWSGRRSRRRSPRRRCFEASCQGCSGVGVKAKICGLMRAEDAKRASEAGASYLGVVFAGGPRAVTQEEAGRVVAASGGVPVLGVFADLSVETILQICDRAGLSGAQLHGHYTSSEAERLRTAGLLVWRVVRIATPADLEAVRSARLASDAVLVEPRSPTALGGTGTSLELTLARAAREQLASHPMVLAGGLSPETVAEAIEKVRPEIADVSSGVELRPGIKDHTKIVRFVEAVFAHSSIA
ncbi:MAG TPA: phosphoribosylanthranilate isomerase [Gemmatimonadales bacterium]|nr:phosphoribosylanthranilate isomerase [Gemmatimonadales bacterium]